ncbi:MAG: RNA polymerase sporulation sigma factor SigG [Oscillospiraceae bacterium]
MQNMKVEICGVNTSKLTLLKEHEKIELIKLAKCGDKNARDKLVKGNLRLVLSVIQRFMNRGEFADDLFQVGCIGLIKAIDNFDLSVGVRFSTYAVPMIIGEVRRFLRDGNTIRVSRSMRDLAYKAMQVKEELQSRKGSEPSIGEIARELSVDAADVAMALESIVEPMSLNEPLYSDSGDAVYIMDQLSDENGEDNWVCDITFKETVKNLSEREKAILWLRYLKGSTQIDVAARIGISQAQVSRLEKTALEKIRSDLR